MHLRLDILRTRIIRPHCSSFTWNFKLPSIAFALGWKLYIFHGMPMNSAHTIIRLPSKKLLDLWSGRNELREIGVQYNSSSFLNHAIAALAMGLLNASRPMPILSKASIYHIVHTTKGQSNTRGMGPHVDEFLYRYTIDKYDKYNIYIV